MRTETSRDYLTLASWLQAQVAGKDLVLRGETALKYLDIFGGHVEEDEIDVYSKGPGVFENVSYRVVESFDGIDFFGDEHGVLCSTASQAFNDIFSDNEYPYVQALIEGLSDYYHANGNSFGGLSIKPENLDKFKLIERDAVDFYDH